ncbi:MAG: ThuA domain-containing protein [Planctomycetota bacterium]|jgi:type 1 glutamine amidotransferase
MCARLRKSAVAVAGCLALAPLWSTRSAAGEAGKARGEGRKLRVIVVTGGHGYDRKTFPEAFKGADDAEVKIHHPGKKSSSTVFDDISGWKYDVIVLYNFRQKMSGKQRANFLALLERGVGLISMHHAIAAYPEWREYEGIIGATYVLKEQVRDGVKYARPKWKHDVDMDIHVETADHPITKGLEDFTINDETYTDWVYHEGNTLLLTTDHKLSNRQIAWTRRHGKANVFYIQLGHGKAAYRNKVFQEIVARGIRWAAPADPPGKR